MDIRSSLDGLKTLLGVTQASPAAPRPGYGQTSEASPLNNDSATLSSAGSEVAQTAGEAGVRADTYEVPASKVATKIVDAMLERGE